MKKLVFWLLALLSAAAFGSEHRLDRSLNEEVVFIRSGSDALPTSLETTIFKPDGDGPFPLVVINHGKEAGDPHSQLRSRFRAVSREFVSRGYVVMLPMRGGFAHSSGSYVDGGCNLTSNGLTQAKDVRSALDYARTLPFVDAKRIVVIGQSHGGLTTMAFGTRAYPGVLGLINFAGGLKVPLCRGWEQTLVDAFADYGTKNHYETLWFYGSNDSLWSNDIVARLYAGYTGAGGKARLVSVGKFKDDAHNLFGDSDGLAIWWPEVEAFLRSLALPVDPLPSSIKALDPVAQQLKEAGEAPVVATNACHKLYARFIEADYPRAFAVSGNGRCGYAYGGDDTRKRAQDFCRGATQSACSLYVVDDEVLPVRN
jgi:dienelactone hydrolase